MKIGVCGTGRMGSSIAQRLMSVGHEVGVWNRNSAKTKPLADAGAKLFASPAELVEGSEAVIIMLLDDAASEAVYRGPNGILKSKLAGKLVIDMSTVRPDTMRAIGAAVAQQGATFVECPVGGSTGPAKEGKLFGLVGGRQARCRAGDADSASNCAAASNMSGARRGRDDEARGQSAAAGLLAGARRGPDDLQAAQSSRRSADRYPVRHRRHADRDEGTRRGHRQGIGRRSRSGKPRSVSAPRKRTWPPRFNSHALCTLNFRSRQARWPALRKPKLRASATPTPPRFPPAGRNARQDNKPVAHVPKDQLSNRAPTMIDQQESLWPHRRTHPRRRRPRPASVIDNDRHSRPYRRAPGRDAWRNRTSMSAASHWRILPMPQARKSMRNRRSDVREVMTTIDRRLSRSRPDGNRHPGRGAGAGPVLLLGRSQNRRNRPSPRQ